MQVWSGLSTIGGWRALYLAGVLNPLPTAIVLCVVLPGLADSALDGCVGRVVCDVPVNWVDEERVLSMSYKFRPRDGGKTIKVSVLGSKLRLCVTVPNDDR